MECWEKNAKHTQMQILVYQVSTSLLELWALMVERIRRRHAERQTIFTSLGSNPGPRNWITIFPLFPLYFLSFVPFKRSFILIWTFLLPYLKM
jgi:hypothetical protein